MTLALILVALGATYLGVSYLSNSKNQSSAFEAHLADFAQDDVDKIELAKGEEQVTLTKEDGQWHVQLPNGKTIKAVNNRVESRVLANLVKIQPDRLITQKPEKHELYQVSQHQGTSVKAYQDNKLLTDLIVGAPVGDKLVYARVTGRDEVYGIEGIFGNSFLPDHTQYRKRTLLSFQKDSVAQVSFHSPALTYTLIQQAGDWLLDYQKADSTTAAQYVHSLSSLMSASFVDDIAPSDLGTPTQTIEILLTDGSTQKIDAYIHDTYQWLLISSENDAVFETGKDDLISKAFRTAQQLTPAH